ncbi:MAG: DUF465 domain-containing protein [Pseudomonadota bacterium]
MPVKHDLFQDLGITKEEVSKRRGADPHLDKLFMQYSEKDVEVVEAEANDAIGVSDDALRKLKEERLLIKDKIVKLLAI